jgi:hypothetical protein
MKSGVQQHNINNSKQQGLHEVSFQVAEVVLIPAVDVAVLHVVASHPHRLESSSSPLLPLPLHREGRGTQ